MTEMSQWKKKQNSTEVLCKRLHRSRDELTNFLAEGN